MRRAIFWDFDGTLTDGEPFSDGCRARPDAAAVLAVCAFKGYKNYILANGPPELGELVNRLGLWRFFSGIVISGTVGACKPDEKIFRIAERTAKFPSLIWMVGDDPVADIEGAKNSGWHTAYITEPGAKSSGAEVTVTGLSELLKFL